MTFSGGDPTTLVYQSTALRRVASDAGTAVDEASRAAATAEQSVGVPELAGSVERFTAAWGGELLADTLALGHFGAMAKVSAEQLNDATGGR